MFNFFKRKTQTDDGIVAPVSGELTDLSNIKDPVFSQKMMGEGFAIIPDNGEVVAPISGEIISLPASKHAVGIKNSNGLEILIHIGLDTVNQNGQGFVAKVKEGQKVKQGQKLVDFDLKLLTDKGYDVTVMTIFTSGFNKEVKISSDKQVKAGDKVLEV